MRLIDTDEYEKRIKPYDTEDVMDKALYNFAHNILIMTPTAQQWISCSERLPEDEYVLISKRPTKISGSKWSVAIAIRTADPRSGKIQWRDSGFGVIPDHEVLAWMPLPEPYGGEQDEVDSRSREY